MLSSTLEELLLVAVLADLLKMGEALDRQRPWASWLTVPHLFTDISSAKLCQKTGLLGSSIVLYNDAEDFLALCATLSGKQRAVCHATPSSAGPCMQLMRALADPDA